MGYWYAFKRCSGFMIEVTVGVRAKGKMEKGKERYILDQLGSDSGGLHFSVHIIHRVL